MVPSPTSSRVQQGEDTRRTILKVAVDVASRKGLDALSIGELAKEVGMSKSGLFAHFGSKEDLQIATIDAASHMFGNSIVKPAYESPRGLARLAALLEGYIRYLEESVFSGGCFFSAAAAEFDDQPGRVRDRIAESMRFWAGMLEEEARLAVEAGELKPAVEPRQLIFELEALTHHANFGRRLLADHQAFSRARTALYNRLSTASTPLGRASLTNPIPTLSK